MGGPPFIGLSLEPFLIRTEMKRFFVSALAACLVAGTGCRDSSQSKSDNDTNGPPHGGTPVLIADHKNHLELVRDGTAGLMQAYVLDDDLHDFIRVPETNFTLVATISPGHSERLEFQRVTNSTTANLAEPSFLFEGRAEWIKAASKFDGLIPTITLKGRTFTNISFPFPKGTQHTH